METQTTTAATTATTEKKVRSRLAPLPEQLKEQFINYFMQRYPCTKSIKLKQHYARYVVKVRYRGEENPRRKFWTVALTYEQLVMRTEYCYSTVRGLTPEKPVH